MVTLTNLAETAGISSSYIDKTGKTHLTDDKVRHFFLKSMQIPSNSQNEIESSYQELTKEDVLPDVLSFFDNETITFTVKYEGACSLSLKDENNKIIWEKDTKAKNKKISIPPLNHGYYTLTFNADKIKKETLLIYAPTYCYQPEFIKNKEHLSGLSLMLYSLRSKDSIGIGDFNDLKEMVKLTAENGGDAVGINPLGVMSPELLPSPIFQPLKGDVSPYRTLSRLFINYGYINLQSCEDFINSKAISEFMNTEEIKNEINRLNSSDKVLYKETLSLKKRILELMFNEFNKQGSKSRQKAFQQYKEEKGQELENLCLFETLLEYHKEETFWRFWRDETDDINSPETESFKQKNTNRINFFAYCHWLADTQLKDVQKYALSLNMKIGLYMDMPIGAASNGAEVWENKEAYVLDARVGAPADPMRPKGQSWGFTPYHPQILKQQKYAPFIRLVRENVSVSGALRIDHAMGLRRLFWGFFEENNPVLQGAYIYYEMKDLTAILAIESNRYKCLLIGEDLGTVPEGFREYMAEHGLLSYKVFFRQKEKDGSFIAPENYMYMSLAQPSTHDQATALGFWSNEDIEVFNNCNLYVNNEQYISNLEGRKKDRINMIKAFSEEHLHQNNSLTEMQQSFEKGDKIPEDISWLVNAYGAKTNSSLFFIRLCDIYKQKVLDNAPGTIDEYTNWRIKLNRTVEEIKTSKEFPEMFKMIKSYRPKK